MTPQALILGGGLAGTTLATRLAAAGCSATLVEQTSAPHDKVCGEFLSQEALHYLAQSGLDLASLGAVPITRVRLAGRQLIAESNLPFAALSLRRRILDEALLARAVAAGVELHRGCRVTALTPDRQVTLHTGQTLSAESLFLATGKHDLPARPRQGGWHNGLIAFKMYFRLSPAQHQALADTVELILFPGGYTGLQPVDSGLANLCLLVTRRQYKSAGGTWPGLLAHACAHSPHLAERLAGATPILARPLALSAIPYGFLAPSPAPGFWPLGDQSAVIPSFSGDGMSIALHSAHLAAATYLAGRSSADYITQLRRTLRPGLTLATALSQLLIRLPSAAHLTRLHPSLLSRIATSTRIPSQALL